MTRERTFFFDEQKDTEVKKDKRPNILAVYESWQIL
jgi:hypothetical protein